MSVARVVVVYDVQCANCSRIARELPDLVRVPVVVRSCHDPNLRTEFPALRPQVGACAYSAVGVERAGRLRWWYGLTSTLGLIPLLRLCELPQAVALLSTAVRTSRARRR